MKHNSFKRIFHRCLEEVKASCDVAKVISVKAAVVTFWAKIDIQIMNRNGFKEPESVRNRLMKKHQIMIDFLEDKFKDYWKNYKVQESMPDCDEKLRNKIWICWWQGIDNAPEIVKACVNTIKRNAGEYEVIVITDNNYKDYVQFPDWLEEKRKKGVFSRTHYSDLLRMSILAKYGGIWIDSTFFCTGRSFDDYMKMPLWSIKRPDYLHCSIASGYFAGYSLGCGYITEIADKQEKFIKHYQLIDDYLGELSRRIDAIIKALTLLTNSKSELDLSDMAVRYRAEIEKMLAPLYEQVNSVVGGTNEKLKALQADIIRIFSSFQENTSFMKDKNACHEIFEKRRDELEKNGINDFSNYNKYLELLRTKESQKEELQKIAETLPDLKERIIQLRDAIYNRMAERTLSRRGLLLSAIRLKFALI